MPARIVVTGVILVIMLGVFVFMVEIFIPVNAAIGFKAECRKALMEMEVEGGLSGAAGDSLSERLAGRGFENVSIDGTPQARQGEDIVLEVEADYTYSALSGLFSRDDRTCRMRYDRTSVSRMVIK